jgi:hypothetical protein
MVSGVLKAADGANPVHSGCTINLAVNRGSGPPEPLPFCNQSWH